MNLANLHLCETRNLGDRLSAPALYFPLEAEIRDLRDAPKPGQALILGGGGLTYPRFEPLIKRHLAAAAKCPVIAWGIGTNTHGTSRIKDPRWLRRCDLAGLRDDRPDHRWVPCASCMAPEFDRKAPPEVEAVVYRHAAEPDNFIDVAGLPQLTNEADTLEEVVTFMLRGEHVITNTYHGMYWATLLGRKVMVHPFASRHHHARHAPVLIPEGVSWRDMRRAARQYPEALEECRTANRAFHNDVKALLAKF